MKRTLRNLAILCTLASAATFAAAADKASKHGYLTDSGNDVVKSGFGLCWHTGFWTPADAIDGCDGMLKKAAPALVTPNPAPAPVTAAPSSPPVLAESGSEPAPAAAAVPAPAPAPAPAPSSAPTNAPAAAPAPAPSSAPTNAPAAAPAPAAEKVTFEADAFFDFDKSVLKPAGKERLTDLVSKLQGTDIEIVIATGHTDSIGTDAYNQKLSLRRANSVKAFLVSKGVPTDRIFTEGKGESQPVASNKTREGRAKNRRVEVEVVGKRKQ